MGLAFDPPLTIGEVSPPFPQYRFISELGVGGQGAAFRVTGPFGEGALKVYGPSTSPIRADLEIEKLRLVASPHVVGLIDHGVVSARGSAARFALMEFIDGADITALCGRHGADVESETRKLVRDIALGIDALWSKRVVHRDIKPPNLRRRTNGEFVILDLGFGRHLDHASITQPGFACGTPGFMSPEQAIGRRALTFRSDLFSLGVSAYQYAAGVHPFQSRQDLLGRLSIVPLSSRCGITPATNDLVMCLMSINLFDRPHTIADVVQATS